MIKDDVAITWKEHIKTRGGGGGGGIEDCQRLKVNGRTLYPVDTMVGKPTLHKLDLLKSKKKSSQYYYSREQ